MADKLNESSWTGFLKKQKLALDDKALVKAPATFDSASETRPEPRVHALEEVVRQIPAQVKALVKRKNELDPKAFGEAKDKLHDLLGIAEKLLQDARRAMEVAAHEQASDEEEESPDLLTSRMALLLREVRKGDVVMQALIALAGKETVVLVSRKPISPARGKLLKKQMTQPSGLKVIRAECLLEKNAVTFVVPSGAAGLAKKIKVALLAQTGLRLPVRVRGEEPTDVDETGADEADEEATNHAAEAGPTGVEPATSFKARLAALLPAIKEAQAAGHPGAQDIRLQVSQAGTCANKQEFEQAHALLDAVEMQLKQIGAAPAGPAVPSPAIAAAAAAFNARFAALVPVIKDSPLGQALKQIAAQAAAMAKAKDWDEANRLLDEIHAAVRAKAPAVTSSRTGQAESEAGEDIRHEDRKAAPVLQSWTAARERVGEQLSRLANAFRRTGHPLAHEIADKGMNGITRRLQVGLQVVLMEYDASGPEQLAAASAHLRSSVADMRRFLQDDAVLPLLEDNPYGVLVTVRDTLGSALDLIETQLVA